MIFRPMIAVKYCNKCSPSTHRTTYVWETIDQCRERLNKEFGKRDYMIKENAVSINKFDVWFISNNNLERMEIYKKYK